MDNLLQVSNLNTEFKSDYGSKQALHNISFNIKEGEVLALVGESGSGKSVTAKAIMQLNPGNTDYNDNAQIIIDNENVLKFT